MGVKQKGQHPLRYLDLRDANIGSELQAAAQRLTHTGLSLAWPSYVYTCLQVKRALGMLSERCAWQQHPAQWVS